jgi:predicted ATP-binding protein involved in virulence
VQKKDNAIIRTVRDLLSLSAGESGLFSLFASIIHDADQAGISFTSTADISGLVCIDEADMHLHMEFQHTVLPRLMKRWCPTVIEEDSTDG